MEDNLTNTTCPIHSFETFGAVDGPGIRFVIFTQGCSLKCKYCQNRDTWEYRSENLYSVKDILDKIQRYKNYIIASNGGVTVSGGEPLLHIDFLVTLFRELKKQNISTAIDTSGTITLTQKVKDLIDLTDLFLLDIKCINDEICKDLTGVSNKKELEFAKYLSSINKHIWIRQVLVPNITDKEEDLINLKQFISSLKTVDKIEVLPYHDMGKFKWENLGIDYPLKDTRVATDDDVKRTEKLLGISHY